MKYKCNVIVCGPAVGKTYLAECDSKFIDLDDMKANYKYGLQNSTKEERERGKLNRGKVVNEDSTRYAIEILKKEIDRNHIVMISVGSKKLCKYLIDNKIDYCVVYPAIDLVDEYIGRMRKRGNSETFIKKLTNSIKWEQDYYNCKNDLNAKYKIELKKGQYLSDIKEKF